MKRKCCDAGLVPPAISCPQGEPSLLGGFGTCWNLVIVVHFREPTFSPGRCWESKDSAFPFRFPVPGVFSQERSCFPVWLALSVRAEMSLPREPAWMGAGRSVCITCLGDEHPYDFMVVQELGNIWPGWRGLGKGVFTPNRFLSPP